MVYVIDFKNLIENVKNGLETVVKPVKLFNLAEVTNKDYLFVIDSYKIIEERKQEQKAIVEIVGKVLKPCNLQGTEDYSGYFHFGNTTGDLDADFVKLNFSNFIEILNDITKVSYGYGVMQVVNFKGFASCKLLDLSGADEPAGEVKQVLVDVLDTTDSIDLEKIKAGQAVQENTEEQEPENWVKVNY